jgi:hypothetical protein
MDHISFVNLALFPFCNPIVNPVVAAATVAKVGSLVWPLACRTRAFYGLPIAHGDNRPRAGAQQHGRRCTCMWGGVISIVNPTTFTVKEP